jgi:hypothetical protein
MTNTPMWNDQGCLGIQNIDIQNKCLLSKWLFKLSNEEGVWQELLRKKYLEWGILIISAPV